MSCQRLLRFAATRFLAVVFVLLLALFLGDLRTGFLDAFFEEDERRLPPKMFSQLSEYCFVAPTRTMLMGMKLLVGRFLYVS
jgi:hypothetical protein